MRHRAKEILQLVNDPQRLREERDKVRLNTQRSSALIAAAVCGTCLSDGFCTAAAEGGMGHGVCVSACQRCCVASSS